jgi:Leucine-rich repeat (LRR) protein
VSGNVIFGMSSFINALKQMKALELLNVGSCSIGANSLAALVKGVQKLPDALKKMKALRFLFLRCCSIEANPLVALVKGVQKLPKLKQLDVSGNVIFGMSSFINALKQMKALELLNVGSCSIEANHLVALVKGVQKLPKLKQLDVSGNVISEENDISTLEEAFKNVPSGLTIICEDKGEDKGNAKRYSWKSDISKFVISN